MRTRREHDQLARNGICCDPVEFVDLSLLSHFLESRVSELSLSHALFCVRLDDIIGVDRVLSAGTESL